MENIVQCPNCGAKNRLRPQAEGTPRCAKCKTPLPWIVDADDSTFDAEVQAGVPVVVDLWAPWCGPCRMVTPVLEDLAREHVEHLKLVKVNVDESPRTAQRFQAMSIPLMVVMRNGEEVDRIVGAVPKQQLEQRLGPVLA
jgi:thioredoxin 2